MLLLNIFHTQRPPHKERGNKVYKIGAPAKQGRPGICHKNAKKDTKKLKKQKYHVPSHFLCQIILHFQVHIRMMCVSFHFASSNPPPLLCPAK